MAEQATGQQGTVGCGIPGSISPYTGCGENANSTWLNGQPFDKDLSLRLEREVRLANDANSSRRCRKRWTARRRGRKRYSR
ncbi:ROK family protein [Klebsiella pneumoniae subsp. pneumoniae]|nr:ROK family protein [Klebsiella pneumoniae subsp. pneumoniae]